MTASEQLIELADDLMGRASKVLEKAEIDRRMLPIASELAQAMNGIARDILKINQTLLKEQKNEA